MSSILMIVLAFALAAVLALFGAQNTAPVTLHFLWFTVGSIPVAVTILGGAVIGALLSLLVSVPSRLRHAFTVRALKRQVARHEARIAQLGTTTDNPDEHQRVSPPSSA